MINPPFVRSLRPKKYVCFSVQFMPKYFTLPIPFHKLSYNVEQITKTLGPAENASFDTKIIQREKGPIFQQRKEKKTLVPTPFSANSMASKAGLTSVFDALGDRKGFSRVQRHCPIDRIWRPDDSLRTLDSRRLRRRLDHRFTEVINVVLKGRRWPRRGGGSGAHASLRGRPGKGPAPGKIGSRRFHASRTFI